MSETQIVNTSIIENGTDRPRIWYLKGLPASGKSGWAKKHLDENTIRLNKDDFRLMMGGKFSDAKEKAVIEGLRRAGHQALEANLNVIIDDTNFSNKHRNYWKQLAEQHKYNMSEIYFDTPVDVCVERDLTRGEASVGAKVITEMYHKYINTEEITHKVAYRDQNPSLPMAIIVDIDGTIALLNGRNPYDNTKVHTDLPNEPIVNLVKLLSRTFKILIVSGREGTPECKAATVEWLVAQDIKFDALFMRTQKDYRKDSTIKKEIFETHIEPDYSVQLVLDDRDQVVDMWRNTLNLPCLQVNYGNF
jgi:predicted kinase